MGGELASFLMGSKIMDSMEKKRLDTEARTEEQRRYLEDGRMKNQALLRQHPTISEESAQLEQLRSQNPQSLEDLFKYKGSVHDNTLPLLNMMMRKDMFDERMGDKKREELDRSVERLSSKMGNAQDLTNTVKGIEKQIGFDLDSYDESSGTVNGSPVNVPGASIPGLGRLSFYSGKARTLANTAQKLFNLELKDRSGAAVTNPEMDRLKQEYSQGKFNSEDELVGAMKRYKSALFNQMQNIQSGFRPDAVNEYEGRGGVTNKVLRSKGTVDDMINSMSREEKLKLLME